MPKFRSRTLSSFSSAPSCAVITGASSGIGAEFARQLASQGNDLILVARRKDLLEEIAEYCRRTYHVQAEIVLADLSTSEGLESVVTRMKEAASLKILVNNAGFALSQQFVGGDLHREIEGLNVMVRAVMVLTHAATEIMIRHKQGVIINVASTAAGTALGTYAAHKTWVYTFTQAIASELEGTGVHVMSVRPGFVETEFFDRVSSFTPSRLPAFLRLTPQRVVRSTLRACDRGAVDVVPTIPYKVAAACTRVAPRWMLRRIVGHGATGILREI